MAVRKIVVLPHPCLRKVAKPVAEINDDIRALVQDMYDTMYDARGVGLAAPQIAVSKRIAVVDVSSDKTDKFCMINPEILAVEGKEIMSEGCLSVPGCYDKVQRPTYIKFRALNEFGETFEREGEGLFAECVQHEIDHLNGKLYVDLLSPLKRNRIIQKLEKYLRRQQKS